MVYNFVQQGRVAQGFDNFFCLQLSFVDLRHRFDRLDNNEQFIHFLNSKTELLDVIYPLEEASFIVTKWSIRCDNTQ